LFISNQSVSIPYSYKIGERRNCISCYNLLPEAEIGTTLMIAMIAEWKNESLLHGCDSQLSYVCAVNSINEAVDFEISQAWFHYLI
jgi:hypothetical protein